jgi:hypothetical protein
MKSWYAVPTLAALAFAAACDDTSRGPTAVDPSTGPSFAHVAPKQFDGNLTCKNLLLTDAAYEIKIDPPKSGSYGPLTVTFSNAGKTVGFTSTVAVMSVFVKGGTDGGNFYDYRTAGTKADQGLVLPTDQQISHVSFCWNDKKDVTDPPTTPDEEPAKRPLSVTNTATGTYTRTITWDLAKTVDVASHSGSAGVEAGKSTWTVTATKNDAALSGFAVGGEIVVSNPNTTSVSFTVDDRLSDGTIASVTCPSTTVAGGARVACTYTASATSESVASSNALVTSTTEGVAGNGAMATIAWTENTSGAQSVTLADPTQGNVAEGGYSESISVNKTVKFEQTFACSANPSDYGSTGSFTSKVTNIATLKVGDADVDLPKQAEVEVTCKLPALTASKSAAGSLDRTITWALTKTVNIGSHSGLIGELAGTSIWTVAATKSVTESKHLVSGTITVKNPAAIAQTFSVSDVLSDKSPVDVNCPRYTLAAGDDVECSYSAAKSGITLNTATILAPGNAGVVATASVSYTATVRGDERMTLADPSQGGYSRVISDSQPVNFTQNFNCSADRKHYDKNGFFTATVTNIATLTGAAGPDLSANANVVVTCRNPWAEETATGAGKQYPGSSNWFMYTGYTTSKVDLIAGQHHDAGDIFMTRTSTGTTIRIVLQNGFRWDDVKDNLKIQDFDSEPKTYVEPGSYKHKFKVSGNTVTVTIPGTRAKFYGIHADTERPR